MRSFINFLSEARQTEASQRAKKMGLSLDASGRWVDTRGNPVAQTQGGKLVFFDKSQKPQQDTDTPQQKRRPEDDPRRNQVDATPEEGGDKEGETVTLVFGRFNPPTVGHKKLLDNAARVAGSGDLKIYPSRSEDPKKNPLNPNQKTEMMKKMFPDHEENIINDEDVRTVFDALKLASAEGYSNVNIVVGSDRVSEFDSLAQKYNGELYDFDEIETISAGERDDDAGGVEGMSASKMRKAASEDDFETFRTGIPDNVDDKDARAIMNTVRKAMRVTTAEGWNLWEIAPKFDWKNLRENYIKGNIFKIDQLVENLNTGLVGKVIRRGTNHLICVTEDNIMFKSWIQDLKEYTEKKMSRKERVPGKPNTLTGTDGYFKYASDMTPGFDKGEKTNLQTGGKPYKGPKSNIREFLNRYKKKCS
jgi:phosphopantetheine adenylyltransferase